VAGPESPAGVGPIVCDASLGGLARWLRAAGCDASWNAAWHGNAALAAAGARGAVLVTTEHELTERRRPASPVVWVSSRERPDRQLAAVARQLDLSRREPRCMACGGALRRVQKEAVHARIPPRTALWLDDYWECAACFQLFWRGTHWDRISARLESALGPPR
jgi:uncharacterized protein with PIN domain